MRRGGRQRLFRRARGVRDRSVFVRQSAGQSGMAERRNPRAADAGDIARQSTGNFRMAERPRMAERRELLAFR